MLRSLFIGFLILSALASNGVGNQINQNITNSSTDMLLELFNAAVNHADKRAETFVASSNKAYFNTASSSKNNIDKLMKSLRQDHPVAWVDSSNKDSCSNPRCETAGLQQRQLYQGEVYSCGTDLSPPHFRLAEQV